MLNMSWVESSVPALLLGFKVSLLASVAAPGLRARDLTDPTTALHQRPFGCNCLTQSVDFPKGLSGGST